MPYMLHLENNGVRVQFSGILCDKENYKATLELYSLPHFGELKYIIWDLSGISKLNMTAKETDVASSHDKLASSRLQQTKVAFVANNKSTWKLCDEYIAQSTNRNLKWDFKVFDNIESVRTWVSS